MKPFIPLAMLALLVGCDNATSTATVTPATELGQQQNQGSETERLNQWFEQKYEQRLQMSPMQLTSLGRKERYGELDDMSEQAQQEMLAWYKDSVEYLKKNFDYASLTDDGKISYDLWVYQYEAMQKSLPWQYHGYMFNQMRGPQSYLPQFLINFHRVDEVSDAEAYISRLNQVNRAMGQLMDRVHQSADAGIRAPYFAYEGVIEQSKNVISGKPFNPDAEFDAPLMSDIKSKLDALVESGKLQSEQANSMLRQAEQALLTSVQPAYQQVIDWFEQDRKNISSEAQGASALPDGEAYYAAQLVSSTTVDMSADEIHQLGLEEVARLRAEMEEIKRQVGFEGDLQAFFSYIKEDVTDERFYYPDTDAGREAYLADTREHLAFIEGKLPDYFGILPKADLVVKRVEAFREQPGAAQHYSAGTPDGSRPGVYYVHLSDMTMMPKNEVEAIAYHEGSPGHHMQISIQQELESVPTFRTQAFFGSYVEGWALYSELLAKEMGAYQDPYSDFGRLVTEIWRAIRLVVDTGIHAKGWSEQQAIDYFKANSPVSEGQILSEIRRYFVWPGQATSYKIGMLKILELREMARQKLGEKFDIRAFHDVVLGGGQVPLAILERRVNQWVDSHE